MNIAIDGGVMTNESSHRGIGVYTRNLVKYLQKIAKSHDHTISVIDVKNNNALTEYDLVHYPTFDFFFNTLPYKKRVPTIVTIHDTIPLLYPKHYPPGVKGLINLKLQKLALKNVQQVITDSETSKKDIVRLLGVKEEKIDPIYLGPTVLDIKYSKKQLEAIKSKYNLPPLYAVYVGDVNWNKNLNNLAAACSKEKIHLVIVGKRAVQTDYDRDHVENKPLFELQSKYGDNPYIHRIGFISDEELPAILKMAFCLCQLSFYEGFGLSILDAMSLEVPTLSAKTQVFMELYESATLFANPYEVEDIANNLYKLKNDKALRTKLSTIGKIVSAQFSWEKTAQQTLSVYERIVK